MVGENELRLVLVRFLGDALGLQSSLSLSLSLSVGVGQRSQREKETVAPRPAATLKRKGETRPGNAQVHVARMGARPERCAHARPKESPANVATTSICLEFGSCSGGVLVDIGLIAQLVRAYG